MDSARYSKGYKARRQTPTWASEKPGPRPRKMAWGLSSLEIRRFWLESLSGAGRHNLVRSLVT
jgi:hypothetical protein